MTYFHVNQISACDIRVSVLLSLLLANIRSLSCFFFLFLVMLRNFLIIPVLREKIKVKLVLAIPTGAPTTLVNEMMILHHLLHLKQLKFCLCNQKQQYI